MKILVDYKINICYSVVCLEKKERKLDLMLHCNIWNCKVLILLYLGLVKPSCVESVSNQQVGRHFMERIQTEWAWKPMGMINTKTEDIEPGDNLETGMINEVEKPPGEEAMSLSMWCKSRKRIKLWKLDLWKVKLILEVADNKMGFMEK